MYGCTGPHSYRGKGSMRLCTAMGADFCTYTQMTRPLLERLGSPRPPTSGMVLHHLIATNVDVAAGEEVHHLLQHSFQELEGSLLALQPRPDQGSFMCSSAWSGVVCCRKPSPGMHHCRQYAR